MADAATPPITGTYEAMFLLGQAGAGPEKALALCRTAIERHGGNILVIKKWDERKLAYEVMGQKRGTYIIAFFTASRAAVAGVERDVRLSDDILRVLVTKADHLNQQEMEAVEPQPIQPREERTFDRMMYSDRPERSDRPAFDGRPERPDRPDRADRPPRPRRDASASEPADKPKE